MSDIETAVLSVSECAKVLKISRALAYQLAREGKLPGALRLGKKRFIVSVAKFERWLNGDGKDSTS